MDQWLEEDFAVAAKKRLYECLDHLDAHRAALLTHSQARWKDLFGATYDLRLYDLTSRHFEGAMEPAPKAKHGYSRDKRSDWRQVAIAVVLSPEGFPLAYEIMPGNTRDPTTLRLLLQKIQAQDGRAKHLGIMDRGLPTEEPLKDMRQSDPPVSYRVGTPRARWDPFKEPLAKVPWQKRRDTREVKPLAQGDEVSGGQRRLANGPASWYHTRRVRPCAEASYPRFCATFSSQTLKLAVELIAGSSGLPIGGRLRIPS